MAALLILSVLVPSLPLSPPSSAALSILRDLVDFLISPAMSLFPSDLITLLPLADFAASVGLEGLLVSEDLVTLLLPSLLPLELLLELESSFPLVFPSDLEPPFFPSGLDPSFFPSALPALLFPFEVAPFLLSLPFSLALAPSLLPAVFPPFPLPSELAPLLLPPALPPWSFPPWSLSPWAFPPWLLPPALLPFFPSP